MALVKTPLLNDSGLLVATSTTIRVSKLFGWGQRLWENDTLTENVITTLVYNSQENSPMSFKTNVHFVMGPEYELPVMKDSWRCVLAKTTLCSQPSDHQKQYLGGMDRRDHVVNRPFSDQSRAIRSFIKQNFVGQAWLALLLWASRPILSLLRGT